MSSLKLSRRSLFKLAGAASLTACSSRPARAILPYVKQPPEVIPGVPRYYATALVEDGFATGVIVETHEGRPTKLEGNPDHPASAGGTRAIEQAAILGLYDPDRLAEPTDRGAPTTWHAIDRALDPKSMHVVLEPTTSPLVIALVGRLRAAGVAVSFYAPFERRESIVGNSTVHNRLLQTQVDLATADVIISLDAELANDPRHARALAGHRRVVDGSSAMSRLYVYETGYSTTGVVADHRWAVRPSQLADVARQLLRGEGPVARDLRRAGSRGVVVAGERQSAEVHALVAQINAASACVKYIEPVVFEAGTASHELPRGTDVRTVVVVGGNPVYASPAFADALANVDAAVYVGLYANETAASCRFAAPLAHDLERWDAARAADGTLGPIQPLIEPIFEGRSVAQVLHAILRDRPIDPRDELAAAWPAWSAMPFDDALARGAVGDSAAPRVDVAPRAAEVTSPASTGIELAVRPHPFVHDGRYANNPWLQELAEPISKLAWDHAAQLSPATAALFGIATGDIIELASGEHGIDVPAIVVPGHADAAITLHAGYGRGGAETIARGIGANAFVLAGATAVTVARTDRSATLAVTMESPSEHGRPVALGGTLAQLTSGALDLAAYRGEQPTQLGKLPRSGPQWAMQIDLTTCTGCSACVMACAAENNTPAIGKRHVIEGRDMHWIRIDRYVDESGTTVVEPMTCQHCEDAPCEYVCPVGATTHSPEGLNEMAYNRCVGTRFCSNNCPYKVRRFNWFDFKTHEPLRVLGKNPNVTVRDRGVMEKCTYCVQRLRRAEIDAAVEHRPLVSPQTACQQACPSGAIAFGTLAELAELRARPHSYAELHDQGTRPRTQYLARIRNPNPEIAE
ncbi:MAG TPA: 4Fe-4S dicluster domain-containing protein [Kofleriaceae bacterium]|jgi:molybdopterin-containing oxidoreductase family iron-sulfur binding subunit|nr:4Fe-4S dicluster domain-containing protein [Kofleriaceae bacterium]